MAIGKDLRALGHLTSARIGLERSGSSLKTHDLLAFDMACAQARDSVTLPLDVKRLTRDLAPLECINVHSAASDRHAYLRYPDLGRRLDPAGAATLPASPVDLAIVVGDGLSSRAAQAHAAPLVREILARLPGVRVGPLIIVEQARVAVADEVGERMNAGCAIILIGERPGLTANDSLSIYLCHSPRQGRTDAEKNCISNIHAGGLGYAEAATQLAWLFEQASRLGFSGVDLKPYDGRSGAARDIAQVADATGRGVLSSDQLPLTIPAGQPVLSAMNRPLRNPGPHHDSGNGDAGLP